MYQHLIKETEPALELDKHCKELVLLHISPVKNRNSILKHGLILPEESSGYGDVPKHKAIYLYHENNINVVYDLLTVFKEMDVWEVRVTKNTLIADEDSQQKTWKKSLETFGTVATTEAIPKTKLKLMATITSHLKEKSK